MTTSDYLAYESEFANEIVIELEGNETLQEVM